MKHLIKALCMLLFVILLLAGCATEKIILREMDPDLALTLRQRLPSYPRARVVVFSDPHIYDTSLGASGSAFEEYLLDDRKLLVESEEILAQAVEEMLQEGADFILLPGDLTKDGERSSHDLIARYLSRIEAAGTPIYVVPGNHDILNPHSVRFMDDKTEPVENVTPEQFRQIYKAFGYEEAIFSDPDSLSYVAEPLPGLWLLALDSCCYRENEENPITNGRFYPSTLDWIQDVLAEAIRGGRAVIAMMHHGVLEHYEGQDKFHGDYVVDDFETVGRMFADYGVRLVLTGHYHAQDITVKRWDSETGTNFIYDIETGALVTHPCPYRILDFMPDQRLIVTSKFITRIDSHPSGFFEYSREFIGRGIEEIAVNTLKGYGVSEKSGRIVAPQVAAAVTAHYIGDEDPPQKILDLKGVGLWGRIAAGTQKYFLEGLWHDLEPPDNRVTIHLDTGDWE